MNEKVNDAAELAQPALIPVGVQELSEALRFLALLGNATDSALEDGKVNVFDFGLFLGLIPNISTALNGIQEVPKEVKDLDEQERLALRQVVANTLKLRNVVTESLVETGVDLTLHFAQFVAEIKKAKSLNASVATV